MALALLLLGLLPMIFMFDLLPDDDVGDDDDDAASDATRVPEAGDLLAGVPDAEVDATVQSGLTTAASLLEPITDDEEPFLPDDVDPDTVLEPVTDDEEPFLPADIDPDTVLEPVTDPGDDAPAAADATALQSLLIGESDFDAGAGWLGDYGPETDLAELAAAETYLGADDGIDDTGLGLLSTHEGSPVVTGAEAVLVVAGGPGNNEIVLGDAPAYAFGGDGDDTITAGEGAAALFGGAGNDMFAASDAAAWIDGGDGNDAIAGGAGDDTLWGGAHGAGDATVPDDDRIDGSAGDDVISGGYGADVLLGGDGDDVIDNLGRVEATWSSTTADDVSWHIDGAADTLDGGAGNDTLIMDRNDTAIGGTGFDTFWVYADDTTGAAEVGDFTVGEDFLRITLSPDLDPGAFDLRVEPSEDGQDAVVRVNGEIVAMLRGAANATEADVLVDIGARL